MKKKVLITTNPLNHEGGVVNYYRAFLSNFKSDEVALRHLVFGSRMAHFYSPIKKRLLYPVFYCYDFAMLFFVLLSDRQVEVVQVSPSLIPVPLLRDGLIVLGAKLMRRQVIVFFRGWKKNVLQTIRRRWFYQKLFKAVYGQADLTIVLAEQFKEDLMDMGWASCDIHVTTTMYEANDILPEVNRIGLRPRLLFLGRISELKGVGDLIEAAALLMKQGIEFECVMVGHGDRQGVVEAFQARVESHGLGDRVRFAGRLAGQAKFKAYAESDIYVLPSWTEGCPNSVLEALGSGMFVVSTDVGALKDIICDGENGRLVRCKDPRHLAEILTWTCSHIEEIRQRRYTIQKEARSQFEMKVVLGQFSKLYKGLVHGKA